MHWCKRLWGNCTDVTTIGKNRTSMSPLTLRYQMNLRDKFVLLENLNINLQEYL